MLKGLQKQIQRCLAFMPRGMRHYRRYATKQAPPAVKNRGNFGKLVDAPCGTRAILSGNAAFALGTVHAGFHAVDGYTGSFHTKALSRSLTQVKHRISVSWSINEATATGAALGRTMAGEDCLITMSVPGIFQAADVISSSAFFNTPHGAMVYYIVTDYIPRYAQHVVDPRHFFASIKLPIIEPSTHQTLYEFPRIAADLSRTHCTPVVVLASDTLARGVGMIKTVDARQVSPMGKADLRNWKTLPVMAARNYGVVMKERIPALQRFNEDPPLTTEIAGKDDWGVIASGHAYGPLHELLWGLELRPSVLLLSGLYPLPQEKIAAFAQRIPAGRLVVLEEGEHYLGDQIERLLNTPLIRRDRADANLTLNVDVIRNLLVQNKIIPHDAYDPEIFDLPQDTLQTPKARPKCLYTALDHVVADLKKSGEIKVAFGDVGCLARLPSFDTMVAEGVVDTIRQGYVLSRPDMASRYISVTSDSSERHSGLDETRNAIFRGTPGVKVVLNRDCANAECNEKLPDQNANLPKLERVLRAEGADTIGVDAYDTAAIHKALKDGLKAADSGHFTAVILHGGQVCRDEGSECKYDGVVICTEEERQAPSSIDESKKTCQSAAQKVGAEATAVKEEEIPQMKMGF